MTTSHNCDCDWKQKSLPTWFNTSDRLDKNKTLKYHTGNCCKATTLYFTVFMIFCPPRELERVLQQLCLHSVSNTISKSQSVHLVPTVLSNQRDSLNVQTINRLFDHCRTPAASESQIRLACFLVCQPKSFCFIHNGSAWLFQNGLEIDYRYSRRFESGKLWKSVHWGQWNGIFSIHFLMYAKYSKYITHLPISPIPTIFAALMSFSFDNNKYCLCKDHLFVKEVLTKE